MEVQRESKVGADGLLWAARGNFLNADTGGRVTGAVDIAAAQPAAVNGLAGSLFTVTATTGRVVARFTNAGDAATGPLLVLRKDRGTIEAPTLPKANDTIGQVQFVVGGTGTPAQRQAALITASCRADAVAGGADTRLAMQVFCSDPGKVAASLTLDNETAAGRSFQVAADNWSLGAAGGVVHRCTATASVGYSLEAVEGIGLFVAMKPTASAATTQGAYIEAAGSQAAGTRSVGVQTRSVATGGANYGIIVVAQNGVTNTGVYVNDIAKAAGSFAIESQADADSYIKSNLGIGWSTPTNRLEVSGSSLFRGTVDVTGNITTTGVAHSFAAGSIPAAAVVGGVANTPMAATLGNAGSMRWDENFLYLRTGTAWKKVALAAL